VSLAARIEAAAWRENLAGCRERPAPGPEGAFNQLAAFTDTGTGEDDPVKTLEAILGAPVPEHLVAELASAARGRALAAPRAAERARHLAALAERAGVPSLARLVAACTHDVDATARLLETLATDGHQLHPCARTRLGWERRDFERYDLEASRPLRVRLIADRAGVLERSGRDFREHPMLAGLDLPGPVLPVHPWQLEHRILPKHAALFDTGRLELLEATVPAWPTAAIRTLAGHRAPGFLKLALGVHITSTRRDISPATALLAPVLSAAFRSMDGDAREEGRHTVVSDVAGAWLPGERDLTAIARSPLHEAVGPGLACVPATALAAVSPVTGVSLAAEYADWSGDAGRWMRDYARLWVRPILDKARMGIGLEAHLQNSLVGFRGPQPVTPVTRDLGGARIHVPTAPFDLELPEGSPVNAASMDQVRSKVAYTLLQNHLASLVAVLQRDCGLDAAAFWADLADHIATLPLSAADRDCYLAPQLPTKALLTMRQHPGSEIETLVDNPLAKGRP
jgi:siderophore synthetase component